MSLNLLQVVFTFPILPDEINSIRYLKVNKGFKFLENEYLQFFIKIDLVKNI